MNIILPKNYQCFDKDGKLEAEVIDEILYIYRPSAFKKIMYELAKVIYGDKCYYCHKEKSESIDHKIPQDFGGPTITDNLHPTCVNCNSEKSNMMEDEYKFFLRLKTKHERKEYVRSLKPIQEDRRFGNIEVLPKEWITDKPYKSIIVQLNLDEPLGSKYKRLKWFFKRYKCHKNPIVISHNGYLLDGYNTTLIGKEENRNDYHQIILENVIVKFRDILD